jgi:hypothetical protein
MLMCGDAAAQTVVGSVPVPSTGYAEVSVNPNTDRVFLGGGFAVNQFAVVNATDPTMPVVVTSGGGTGSGMVVNPVTNLYYTTNGFAGQVQRFDGTSLAGNGNVTIGACGGALDVDTATNLVYVTRQCGGGGGLGVDPLYVIDGATMAIVGNNLGTGGVVGSVRVNSTTGRAYVNRGTIAAIFGPSPGFASGGTLPETIGAINPVTNRLYLIASGNLVVRDGSNEALITTIMGVGGSAAVNTNRNRIYTMTGGQINVIDGASNTSLGSFSLGAGVSATGVMTVDSAKNRLYAIGVSGGTARLYVVDDNPVDPGCQVQVSQGSYVNGETVTIPVFHISNPTPEPVNVELKFWLGSDAFAPIGLANVPTIPLPSGFDQNLGPLPLFPVTAAWPRGDYEVGCRLLDPVTGKTRAQSFAPFVIQ